VLAPLPIISIIYFTYEKYLEDIRATAAQAERAECERAEAEHARAEAERLRAEQARSRIVDVFQQRGGEDVVGQRLVGAIG